MSSDSLAIRADRLSKRYRLGARQRYRTLREALVDAARAPFRRRRAGPRETIWALRDVSFEIRRGEVVGVIGRNGAGKSTLLKILSRITEPTSGRAELYGRVGSLLEVGTGFHSELTGRENTFLSGAILGMRRAEIERKFDEIVAFAEVERFVDTPVKHYSSGMYLRLAFAVAAHLEPEILLVDEVLAVGDAAFQKRCLGKMSSVAREGRTVLFVSHDLSSVSQLCSRGILLAEGTLVSEGAATRVIATYLSQSGLAKPSLLSWSRDDAPGDHEVRLIGLGVRPPDAASRSCFMISDTIQVDVEYEIRGQPIRLNPSLTVKNLQGTALFSTANYSDPLLGSVPCGPGRYFAHCRIPGGIFNEGVYSVDVMLVQDMRYLRVNMEAAVGFEVRDDGADRGDYVGPWRGLVRPRCKWHGEKTDI